MMRSEEEVRPEGGRQRAAVSPEVTVLAQLAWSLDAARAEVNRLRMLVDGGTDPRELQRQQQAEREARKAAAAAVAVTVGEAWTAYLAERRPYWGECHRADHEVLAKAGGEPATRGTRGLGKTIAAPIHPLLTLDLRALDTAVLEAWAAGEAKARLALQLLKAFLDWCAEYPWASSDHVTCGSCLIEVGRPPHLPPDTLMRHGTGFNGISSGRPSRSKACCFQWRSNSGARRK
jgi:hypothetical protein